MRVRLVVTGDMEKAALAPSLERVLRAAGADVTFDRPLLRTNAAMTSNPLGDPSSPTSEMPRPVRRMADALVNETLQGRRPTEPPPDLVIGIDDLELANLGQPHVVTAWLRRAIEELIRERFTVDGVTSDMTDRVREALQTRCSFHLLVPLAEAYLFGEDAALTRAGVAAGTPVHRIGEDVEAFETDDPAFLPAARTKNSEMANMGHDWWREERHPKHYLEFLVAQSSGVYDETVGGARALERLDWVSVGRVATTVPCARALFEDLCDALAIPNPLGTGALSACTYPARNVRREALLLRNL